MLRNQPLWGPGIFVAYLGLRAGVYAIGGEQIIEAALVSTGLISVLIGVAVEVDSGLPSPQIIFVSLYLLRVCSPLRRF